MQNIKNFKVVEPTTRQIQEFTSPTGEVPIFLKSEDGQYWHECYDLFADDTVKIMYDSNGLIMMVVDKPVPQRGNIYAVSMLYPENMSVAEIAVDDYPAGVTLGDVWKFDGEKVYKDNALVQASITRDNIRIRNRYMRTAMQMITAIQCSAAVSNPRDGDDDKLLALQLYVDELRDVDLSVNPAAFPPFPQ